MTTCPMCETELDNITMRKAYRYHEVILDYFG